MGRLIGIDLGTTNSVAAIVDGPQPRVLENREARTQTRSAVGLRTRRGKAGGGAAEVLVGDAAIDNWPLAPKDTIISIKRLMGRGAEDEEVSRMKSSYLYSIVKPSHGTKDSVRVLLGNREYSPIEISSLILKKIKDDAEFRLGDSVTHAVITVPAYFSQIQRDATRKAGLMAGLKVIKILDEPTAAAIAFGVQARDDTPRTVLVYDLGGGTFDISVLMCAGHVFAPLNLEGDMWLGGDNFDQVLVDHAIRHIQTDYDIDPRSNLRFMAELRRAAQTVKERLSSAESAELFLTGLLQDRDGNLIDVVLEITRTDFERMILPFVGTYVQCSAGHPNFETDRACARCGESISGATLTEGRALTLTRKALQHQSVNLRPDQVDYVVMAGNSTNTPLVQRTMERLFGAEKVVRKTHPKHAVALGAAMVAAWMGQRLVCQAPDPNDPTRECGEVNDDHATVCAKCGVSLVTDPDSAAQPAGDAGSQAGVVGDIAEVNYGTATRDGKFNLFVRKGDPRPTQEMLTLVFATLPRQRVVSIPIYGGEVMERAAANQKQGEAFAVLPADLPPGSQVRVKLWLNRDGICELSAHLDNGINLHPWIVKGEEDAAAIQLLEQVEEALAQRATLDSGVLANVEAGRNRVFENLRNRKFEDAYKEAERVQLQARAAASPRVASKEVEAQGLLQWSRFVLGRYAWAFDPSMVLRLRGLIDQLTGVLEKQDANAIAAASDALDVATRTVPAVVAKFLQMRHAIHTRIRPADPGLAGSLVSRVEDVEQAHADGTALAGAQEALEREINEAMQQIARTTGQRCSQGHEVPKGSRFCPTCQEDTWSLDAVR